MKLLEALILFNLTIATSVSQASFRSCRLTPNPNGIYLNTNTGAFLRTSMVQIGTNVTLTCHEGFDVANGPRTSRCNSKSHWVPSSPGQCLTTCGQTPTVQNGHVLHGSSSYDSQRRLLCNDGYTLRGSSTLTCRSPTRGRFEWTRPGLCVAATSAENTTREWMTRELSKVSPSPLGTYRFAGVAADSGICSQIGTEMLGRGGSAVDAAVAAVICDNVVNLHFAGIGGGQFVTIWDNQLKQAFTVDARETAPLSATEDMFESGVSSVYGGFAIGVPGLLAGLGEIHAKFGKLPWAQLFQHSIELCRNGFEVSKSVEIAIAEVMVDVRAMANQTSFEEFKRLVTNKETRTFFKAGETMYCPKFAETLEKIASNGYHEFYNGSLAEDILADLSEAGSPIQAQDLKNYRPEWRKPVNFTFHNITMYSMPPPGSGAILAFMLNILTGYNFSADHAFDPLTFHRYIEALKFAYAKRTFMGDSSFQPEMAAFVANLTSPDFGDQIRSLINDSSTQPSKYYAADVFQQPRTAGTSQISIVDGMGNAVAVTSTINTYFGSLIVGKRTGIIFNNEMDDFSTSKQPNAWGLVPSRANAIRPGKRPVSSMCPTIFTENQQVRLVIGGAGGSKITSGVASVALRNLIFGQDIKQAVDAPRLHHQLYPEAIQYERDSGMAPLQLLQTLKTNFGHVNQTQHGGSYFSIIQAIERTEDGTLRAISDPRQPQGFTDGF